MVRAKTSALAASTFTHNLSTLFATSTPCPIVNFERVELLKLLSFNHTFAIEQLTCQSREVHRVIEA
jgi:hypothetical protein